MSRSRNNTAKLDALLASVTKDVLGGEDLQQLQEQGMRVERILLELVRPDPVQPRRFILRFIVTGSRPRRHCANWCSSFR
jgi:hypothetical protein